MVPVKFNISSVRSTALVVMSARSIVRDKHAKSLPRTEKSDYMDYRYLILSNESN